MAPLQSASAPPLWRRRFLIGLPALALLRHPARGQPAPRRIGVLSPYAEREYEVARAVLVKALLDLGYVRDRHYVLVERLAEGHNERLPALAAALVASKVDLIYVSSTNAARAASQATSTLPIVFESVADPVLAGFADSIGHPGRNMTGLSNFTLDLSPKRLQLLKRMVPRLTRLALLANPTNPYYATQMQRIRPHADRLGLQLVIADARDVGELDAAFEVMDRARAGAVLVTADAYLWTERQRVADLALTHRLPSMFSFAEAVAAGGLMSYGIDATIGIRRLAIFIDKILRGTRPGDIPIEQPTRVDLTLNRHTADALGLAIPKELLLQAEKVIE